MSTYGEGLGKVGENWKEGEKRIMARDTDMKTAVETSRVFPTAGAIIETTVFKRTERVLGEREEKGGFVQTEVERLKK